MRRFILKCFIYTLPVVLIHLWVANCADGITDAYYLRFTSPPQQHLIIGSSKAAQGLRPEYLNEAIGLPKEGGLFNYAFTLNHSPYGKIYRESISRKLDPQSKDGIYIVEVDSWNLSGKRSNPEDESLFKEATGEVGTTHFVNMSPNYEYLVDNYPNGWLKLAWKKWKPSPSIHELHSDGWLEIDLPMDEQSHGKRVTRKVKEYTKNPSFFGPSRLRRSELGKTIEMLKKHGTVYLVRMPVSAPIAEIEYDYMPTFDSMMDSMKTAHQVSYIDLRQQVDTFRYVDGNHLYRASSKSVSIILGGLIKEDRGQ